MPQLTSEYRDEAEWVALEHAIAYVTDLHRLAQTAVDGTVLGVCEQLALDQGRELLRSTLAAALSGRIRAAEQ